ncbi:MAG: dihydrodipicolinate synthase family protein [Firmicutes bacterium]|nr:dihydrodipicolinate synthase family protein [Bacillota bacterium]
MAERGWQGPRPAAIVPVLTAFDPDGNLDWAAMSTEVEYLLEVVRPAMVAVAAVEVSEYQYLSEAERVQLIRGLAQRLRGRIPFMVGISHPSPRQVWQWAALAEEEGADAVQLLLPQRASGGQPSRRELVAYVQAVASRVSLPLFLYHNPGPGTEVGPLDLEALAKVPEVAGIKESSRNLRHIGLAQALLPARVGYFVTMEVLLSGFALGAAGGTMPPPAALVGRRLLDAAAAGRWEEAQALQRVFGEFPARWMSYGLAAVMKAAMEAVGVPIGDPYPPCARLAGEDREALKAYIAKNPAFEA